MIVDNLKFENYLYLVINGLKIAIIIKSGSFGGVVWEISIALLMI